MNLNSSGDQGQSQLAREAGEGLRSSSTIAKDNCLYSVCVYPAQSQLYRAALCQISVLGACSDPLCWPPA